MCLEASRKSSSTSKKFSRARLNNELFTANNCLSGYVNGVFIQLLA